MSKKRQSPKLYPHRHPKAKITTLAYDYADAEVLAPHFHSEDQWVFASQGVMTVTTEHGVWFVPPAKAVWIPARVIHSIRMSGPVAMRTLYFVPKFVKGLPARCTVMNVSPLLRELTLHACRFPKLSTRVASEKRVIGLLLDELLVAGRIPLQLPLPTDPRAKRVAEALIGDPGDGRLLGELCRGCGASKRTIERLFQEQTRLTLGRWRQQLRMLQSIHKLVAGEKVITVALEAGYQSPSAFIAAFRKILGTTPSLYGKGDA